MASHPTRNLRPRRDGLAVCSVTSARTCSARKAVPEMRRPKRNVYFKPEKPRQQKEMRPRKHGTVVNGVKRGGTCAIKRTFSKEKKSQKHTRWLPEKLQNKLRPKKVDLIKLQKRFHAFYRKQAEKSKLSYVYLLLDPRKFRKKLTALGLPVPKNLKQFIHACKYVGKSSSVKRPHWHMQSAVLGTCRKSVELKQLMTRGKGVVVLRCFQDVGDEESYAIESILIETIDRSNLTNKIGGHKRVRKHFTLPERLMLGNRFLSLAFEQLRGTWYTLISNV